MQEERDHTRTHTHGTFSIAFDPSVGPQPRQPEDTANTPQLREAHTQQRNTPQPQDQQRIQQDPRKRMRTRYRDTRVEKDKMQRTARHRTGAPEPRQRRPVGDREPDAARQSKQPEDWPTSCRQHKAVLNFDDEEEIDLDAVERAQRDRLHGQEEYIAPRTPTGTFSADTDDEDNGDDTCNSSQTPNTSTREAVSALTTTPPSFQPSTPTSTALHARGGDRPS